MTALAASQPMTLTVSQGELMGATPLGALGFKVIDGFIHQRILSRPGVQPPWANEARSKVGRLELTPIVRDRAMRTIAVLVEAGVRQDVKVVFDDGEVSFVWGDQRPWASLSLLPDRSVLGFAFKVGMPQPWEIDQGHFPEGEIYNLAATLRG